MKKIGMIGGMSWESTLEYYKMINQKVNSSLGGLSSAKILLESVDFGEIEKLQHNGDWEKLGNILLESAKNLEKAGADFLIICTNTMHKVAPKIEQNVKIPLLHLADATGEKIKEKGFKKVGLLGTKFTMEQDFYKGRLEEKFGLEIIIPDDKDREKIHNIIYNELCLGKIFDNSRESYLEIMEKMRKNGTEAIILGCTEIPLLINENHTDIPLFDTTKIHAIQSANYSLV